MNLFITRKGNGRATNNAYIEGSALDVDMYIFSRSLGLILDKKAT